MTINSLMEQFGDGVAAAVTDIREKVVEEGWFGRTVTDQTPVSSTSDTPNSFEEYVQQTTRDAPAPKEEIAPDNGIDR